jgi:hypothetical protein
MQIGPVPGGFPFPTAPAGAPGAAAPRGSENSAGATRASPPAADLGPEHPVNPAEEDSASTRAGDGQRGAGEKANRPDDPAAADRRQIEQLRARDRQVRAHEQAHLAAAGGLARGGASFKFTEGPDGKRYAVGGEVRIDTSEVSGDPEATVRKARQIRQAALAPADPSAADISVAQRASAMEQSARVALAAESAAPGERAPAEPERGTGRESQGPSTSQESTPTGADPAAAQARRRQLDQAIASVLPSDSDPGANLDSFV